MYLEVLFALSIPMLLLALESGRVTAMVLAAGAALLVIAQASIATFTRAGAVAMLASLGVVAACRVWKTRRVDATAGALAAVGFAIVAQFALSHSKESLWLRWSTESTKAWYAASIDAPDRLQMATGGSRMVTLTIRNVGRTTWDSTGAQRFRLSYHWLTADGSKVVSWEGQRTALPAAVGPGASVRLTAEVVAPRQPGDYLVLWDIEQEHRLWFSTEPDAVLTYSIAKVSGAAAGPPLSLMPLPGPLRHGAFRPGRRVLWPAALRMALAHPLTGVGPDNFRLLYGPYVGIGNPDPRLHSNNMYLEVLAGTGLAGAAAFLFAGWRTLQAAGSGLARALASAGGPGTPLALASGVLAAGAAIALHGLVDSFLSFTATYVLFAIALALVARLASLSTPHAHRL
jgi:hypothetical protein